MSSLNRRQLISGVAGSGIAAAFMSAAPAKAATSSTKMYTGGKAYASSYDLFKRGQYVAKGTIFTRSVKNMPVARNSAQLSKNLQRVVHEQYAGAKGFKGLMTSGNTESYNIPIYVVDSTVPGCATRKIKQRNGAAFQSVMSGDIPCPPYAIPAYGNDMSLAIYDVGTGIMREYFHIGKQADGTWEAAFGGYSKANPGLLNLAKTNFPMQLPPLKTTEGATAVGSSAVVAMHNPLSQIGLAELADGQINHAVSVTLPNAAPGFSYPAQKGDGYWTGYPLPKEGQWFRIPPHVNIEALGLSHITYLIAKAVQRYGGYGADHNAWDVAFNFESDFTENLTGKPNHWREVSKAMANTYTGTPPFLNDFPWDLVEWAEPDWKGTEQAPDAKPPIRYSGWTYTTKGKFASTPKIVTGDLALLNQAQARVGQRVDTTFSGTVRVATTTRVRVPLFVDPHTLPQVVIARVDGNVVAQTDSHSKKPMEFTLKPGSHKVSYQLLPQVPKAGKPADTDITWVGPMTIVQ